MSFTHLHLHSEYSLLDGAIRLRDLPDRLAELGMQACAITDHGALYGAVDFYNALMSRGIKPILGCEVYVAPRSHTAKEGNVDKEPSHLILLAENMTGWKNLMKLVSIGFIAGFYYRPRIDHDLLRQHASGLIALSACLGGEIPGALLEGNPDRARKLALEMDEIFGRGNFFLELQHNGITEQNLVNSALIGLSQETGIPLVATNDCHYLNQADARAHEVLLCMQTGKRMTDPDRMRMQSDEFYLKSPAEMEAAFAAVPEALANTGRIAARCEVVLDFTAKHLPAFAPPDGLPNTVYLEQLCQQGLDQRLQLPTSIPRPEYERRLAYELSVINQMNFTDYYLIVWDFIRFAHEHQIMVGPGRGSGAGSLAAYCLGITNIDPLKYSLIFERFLNADRVSMPDFDIDFCYERRPEVIAYVTQKYGQDRVAQVITFGTLAARACIRDVARALDVPYAETDRIAKLVPGVPGITLRKALDQISELKQEYDSNPVTHEVIDLAMRFEGMPRHASTHAAGVVIASEPLTELAPLSRNEDAVVVQYAKNNIELIGLLKFDFLGLRTLTVMRDTADMVWRNHHRLIDFDVLPMDDPAIFAMISEGNTEAVFQLESPGMTSFMKDLRPESLEDVIAGISLFRPGPMDQIPRYVAAKHDHDQIHYDHPLLEPILNVTYGCIVYQEQVMQIVRDLAGFSMGQSDNVRKAMSKKKPAELAKYKNLFLYGGSDEKGHAVPGALARGVQLDIAEKIFEDVMQFAGYAFNKAHAASYAVVAYYTAWLKLYYPVEFMAAMLNSYMGSLKQAAAYVRVCRKMGLEVLPPDINFSATRFVTENGKIRFSLAAVKNVGESAIRSVIRERETGGLFGSFGDFLRRLGESELNRKMIESLIRASAFDSFGVARSRLIAVIEPFLAQLATSRRQSLEGQLSFFELGAIAAPVRSEPDYPALPDFTRSEQLAMEKEMLGLYITGHPLDDYAGVMHRLTTVDSAALSSHEEQEDGETALAGAVNDQDKVIMAGMLVNKKTKTTRSNELMAFLTLEDLTGTFECLIFPRIYAQNASLFNEGETLLVAGRLNIREDDTPKLVAEAVARLEPQMAALPQSLTLWQASKNTAASGNHREGNGRGVASQASGGNYHEGNGRGAASQGSGGKSGRGEVKPLSPIQPDQRLLVIRYQGEQDDDGWQQLLAMLRFFHGSQPVRVYLAREQRLVDLPADCYIEMDDKILQQLALRYGVRNLVLL